MHVSSSSYDLHISSSSCDMRVSLARHSTYRATTFPQKACECSSRHWHTFSEVLYTVTFFSFFDEHEHTFSKVLYVVNILYIVALCSKKKNLESALSGKSVPLVYYIKLLYTKGTDFPDFFLSDKQRRLRTTGTVRGFQPHWRRRGTGPVGVCGRQKFSEVL
jgi:hypothetical protein